MPPWVKEAELVVAEELTSQIRHGPFFAQYTAPSNQENAPLGVGDFLQNVAVLDLLNLL